MNLCCIAWFGPLRLQWRLACMDRDGSHSDGIEFHLVICSDGW